MIARAVEAASPPNTTRLNTNPKKQIIIKSVGEESTILIRTFDFYGPNNLFAT